MKRVLPLVLLLVLTAFLYWRRQAPSFRFAARRPEPARLESRPQSQAEPATVATPDGTPATAVLSSAASPLQAAQLASNAAPAVAEVEPLPPELATLPPATVIENMRTAIRNYGSTFGGNPVGTNPEITSALQGNNPKHINFLKADGNRVNARGEMVDPWGTPYFFHQLSGTEMEIHSAGPDRRMWTGDDLVTK